MSLPLNPKLTRTMDFLIAAQVPNVARALNTIGFDDAAASAAWRSVNRSFNLMLDAQPDATSELLEALVSWEQTHFPIIRSTFGWYFNEYATARFLWVAEQVGPNVALRVDALLTALRRLGATVDGPDALELLAVRGVDANVRAEASELLARLATYMRLPTVCPAAGRSLAEAEDDLWSRYLSWSSRARTGIQRRRVLETLGLVKLKARRRSRRRHSAASRERFGVGQAI